MNNFIFNPCRYHEKFFWSLKEALDPNSSKESYQLNNADLLTIINSLSGFTTSVIVNQNWANENYAKVIDLVISRFNSYYCFATLSPEYSLSKRNEFATKLIKVLEMTSARYLKLLEVYASASQKLLDPVKIETSRLTRFNDTPQDEGDFANDEHTTNLTEDTGTTKNDLDTPMGRIREIAGNYQNLILEWSNEFKGLFIEEDNI